MENIIFIGELPPPYGGVAVKDALAYQMIFKELDAQMIDLVECKRSLFKIPGIFIRIIAAMISGRKIIIGVGTPQRRKILLQMQKFFGGKKGLKNTTLLGMGGRIHEMDAKDPKMQSLMKQIGSIWVETDEMIKKLQLLGINNAFLFPNCRTNNCSVPPGECEPGKLKLVFFSRICPEKGVDLLIDVADRLPEGCTLDFYGEIAADYKEVFESFIEDHPKVNYHGVFDATNGDVYQELNRYDVMLLPSRWIGEGVPGALVESKMSGITAIVSDWNFNREIVVDGIEGIVLEAYASDSLLKAINMLYQDREITMSMKQKAFESRGRYDVETYKEGLQKAVLE